MKRTLFVLVAMVTVVVLAGTAAGTVLSDAPGESTLEVDGLDNAVAQGPPGELEVSDLTAPENVSQGESIEVEATVTNVGEESASGPVKYEFDGTVGGTESVSLDPEENTTVSFEYEPNDNVDPGTYTHGVTTQDDEVTAEIEIEGEGDGDDGEGDLAPFTDTSPLGPDQTDPDNLGGKLRVEDEHVDNTTIVLTNDTATNSTLEITVTGNATNVTFYLQEQAIEASQDLDNVTAYLDGEEITYYADAGPGNSPWIGFEVDHFSTRTVTFATEDESPAGSDWWDDYTDDDGVASSAGQHVVPAIQDFVETGEPSASQVAVIVESYETGTPVPELAEE